MRKTNTLKNWLLSSIKKELETKSKLCTHSEMGLMNISEMDLTYSVAVCFARKGYSPFFEVHPQEDNGTSTLRECDLLITKNKREIWIECKQLYSDDKRLYKKRFKEDKELLEDINKLRSIRGSYRRYFIIFTKSNSENLDDLPTKRNTGKRYSIHKALNILGFNDDDMLVVKDTHYNDKSLHYHTIHILHV